MKIKSILINQSITNFTKNHIYSVIKMIRVLNTLFRPLRANTPDVYFYTEIFVHEKSRKFYYSYYYSCNLMIYSDQFVFLDQSTDKLCSIRFRC